MILLYGFVFAHLILGTSVANTVVAFTATPYYTSRTTNHGESEFSVINTYLSNATRRRTKSNLNTSQSKGRKDEDITKTTQNKQHNDYDDTDTFILPIFPLRKQIKFPTDSIQLNLYEERYINLAEYVLSQNNDENNSILEDKSSPSTSQIMTFGGLYCSHKPQISSNGNQPITPIIERGDVGTVMTLQESEVILSPDVEKKKKIRLTGLGVGRFCVQRVLSNGFGGSFDDDDGKGLGLDENGKPLKFILVEASVIQDDYIIPGSKEDILSQETMKKIQRNLQFSTNDEEDEFGFRIPLRKGSDCTILDDAVSVLDINSNNNDYGIIPINTDLEQEEYEQQRRRHQQRQLESFALTSKLLAPATTMSTDMLLEIMKETSTSQRLRCINDYLVSKRGVVGWISRLFD